MNDRRRGFTSRSTNSVNSEKTSVPEFQRSRFNPPFLLSIDSCFPHFHIDDLSVLSGH